MVLTETPRCSIGWRARPFSLRGVDDEWFTLEKISSPTLVMFICNHCPYVKAIIHKIKRDADDLKREFAVESVAIMPNDWRAYPEDSFDNMKKFAQEHRLDFPYLLDEDQSVAKEYGAVCTPDFFGFNSKGELQYRGRLDSSGRKDDPGAKRELFEAMGEIAQTQKGPTIQHPSMGCSIKWRA